MIEGKGLTRDGPGARWRKDVGERPLSMSVLTADQIAKLEPDEARMMGRGNKAIAFRNSRGITLRDLTIRGGGHMAVLATGVEDLLIDGLLIDTERDGIDLDCVRRATVANCRVNSPNDDAIVLKSSCALGRPWPTEDVVISGCTVSGYDLGTMLDGSLGREQQLAPDLDRVTGRIKIGTESNGDFRRIRVESCRFERCRGVAIETVDGGAIEDVSVAGVTMDDVTTAPLFVRLGDRGRGPPPVKRGSIRGVTFEHLEAKGIDHRFAATIAGISSGIVEGVTLKHVRLVYEGGGTADHSSRQPPELPNAYPEPSMFGVTPAWGLWVRRARGVRLDHIVLETAQPDAREPMQFDDVADLALGSVSAGK
jgi:polygalacturonase